MRSDEEFREFVAGRYPALVRTARLLAPDPAQAEDLTQSALVRTYVRWHTLHAPGAAEAYTRTVLVRLAMRATRRRWRGELATERLPEPAGAGADAYVEVDETDAVRRALATLPADQRAVLVLRYYAQLSEAEIAETLRCSPGTVKSRASRAIAALRAGGLLTDALEASDG